MTYANEKANLYKDNQNSGNENFAVDIVSPKGLISTNNIETLGIETIGEEKGVSQRLDKSAPEKQIQVKQEIINNNDNGVENVSILGTFGTNGKMIINGEEKQSNTGEILQTGLSIETTDSNKIKVYYTQNENASEDLSNQENGWSEQITDSGKTRKYLITVASMEMSESLGISYQAQIPANLEYNQQNYQGYQTTYTESSTGTVQKVDATAIELKTGNGPVVDADLKERIGNQNINNGSEVKEGEILKYIINVTNTGSEEASNITITGKVPEGTVLVEENDFKHQETPLTDESDPNNGSYYKEVADTSKTITIDSLKAGSTSEVFYEVRVKKGITDGTVISNNCELKYGEVSKTTNTIINTLKTGEFRLTLNEDTKGTIYTPGNLIYTLTIENTSGEAKDSAKIKLNLPEKTSISSSKLTLVEQNENYDESSRIKMTGDLYKNQEIYTYPDGKGPYITKSLDYSDEIDIGDFNKDETKTLTYNLQVESLNQTKNIATSVGLSFDNNDYRSNELINTVKTYSVETNLEIDNTNYLNTYDEFNYTITVKNNSGDNINYIKIQDEIPNELIVKKITVNGIEVTKSNGNSIEYSNTINANSEIKMIITCEVLQDSQRTEAKSITNSATVNLLGEDKRTTNSITSIILKEQNSNNSSDNNNNNDNNETIEKENGKSIISGIAWKDDNNNGIKEGNENILSGISVKLLNISTNQYATNSNGTQISSISNEQGTYILNNVPDGSYLVVFEYDTTKYKLTAYHSDGSTDVNNSDAIEKELTIDNNTKKYGVTDSIIINQSNVGHIDIGLIQVSKFNMSLSKNISKIIVQNSAGTKVYQYNNTDFAKIEINSKKINNSNVIIEYSIVVTNNGEIEGYVKNIVDYMPNDLKFSSELNKDWYQKDKRLYNNSLSNISISPGESKAVTLTLTKKMTENNTGIITNTAEIAETYNEYGIDDINSIPSNNKSNEDDIGKAEIIISVSTGTEIGVALLIVASLTMILSAVIIIKKKVL